MRLRTGSGATGNRALADPFRRGAGDGADDRGNAPREPSRTRRAGPFREAPSTATNDDTGFVALGDHGGDGFYNLSLQPGPYTVDGHAAELRDRDPRRRDPGRADTQTLDVELSSARRGQQAAVTVTGGSAGHRDEEQRGRHQRQRAADPAAAPGQPQLPRLRGARARRPLQRLGPEQDGHRGRRRRQQRQRLHRRHELQERRPDWAASRARTRAAAIRFRRTPSRSSASSRRTSRRSTRSPRARSSRRSPSRAATTFHGDAFGEYQDKSLRRVRRVLADGQRPLRNRARRQRHQARLHALAGRRLASAARS